MGEPLVGEGDPFLFFIDLIIALRLLGILSRLRVLLAFLQIRHNGVGKTNLLGVVGCLPADDQRGAGFVDEDGVDLVDDAIAV